ncbi:MAG: RNA polymerase sigma factor [Byssovorax sp.]
MGTEDAELVTRLRRREPAAFDDVYARYHPRIFRFLLRLAGGRQLAEDLFQDTWLAAARHAGDLAEDTDLGAWLFTIARNRFRSHRRWAFLDFTQRERLAHEPTDHAPPPDRDAEARAEAAAVTEAFARLTPAHREVLLLAVVEGLTTAQVGAVLSLKPDAVRQRISRARTELATHLETENAVARVLAPGAPR